MKVLIVDDDALIRDSLSILFRLEEDFQVVGTASNGREAFEKCTKVKPDIVLMDVRMPIMDGVLGTKLIKENFEDIKVVILTTFKDDEYIMEAVSKKKLFPVSSRGSGLNPIIANYAKHFYM